MAVDWLGLTRQLNRQAFGKPPVENWLRAFLEAVRAQIPAIDSVQVIQMANDGLIVQAASGPLSEPPAPQIASDAGSPVRKALDSHERQIAPDMRVYPILYGDDAVGALIVRLIGDTSGVAPAADDVLSALAIQLGPAIRQMDGTGSNPNTQLYAELEGRAAQLEQIAELSRRVMSTLDQSAILRIVATATRPLIAVDGISVALRWPGEHDLRLYLIEQDHVLPAIAVPFDQAALRAAYESRTSLIADNLNDSEQPDYQIMARHAAPDEWESGQAMRTALIVPLVIGDRSIGTYNLTSRRPDAFTTHDQATASQIVQQLAISLENSRLFAQASERVQIEQIRSQIGTGLGAGDLATLILETTQGIGRALDARRARVRLMPPSEESAG